jgi:hypothetical protein
VSGKTQEEQFDDEDRDRMLSVVRSVSKPCLVIKILGASRKCDSPEATRDAFAFTFDRIKSTDAVVVGMYPKYRDQVAENARIVRELLSPAAVGASA